jgi:hypothetical protein
MRSPTRAASWSPKMLVSERYSKIGLSQGSVFPPNPPIDSTDCFVAQSREELLRQLVGALPPPHTAPFVGITERASLFVAVSAETLRRPNVASCRSVAPDFGGVSGL